jgi:hypothetical protein
VVELRRAAGGRVERQRQLVAERFVTALAAGDTETVTALIDPEPFVQTGAGWTATRAAYARDLTGGPLAAALQTAVVAKAEDGSFAVTRGETRWRLATIERDNMTFVASLGAVESGAVASLGSSPEEIRP